MKLKAENTQYIFTASQKKYTYLLLATGFLGLMIGFLLGESHAVFANLLLMSYYFFGVCLSGVIFVSVQYISRSGWSASILRIPQALSTILPIASVILFLTILLGLFSDNLYSHWSDSDLINPQSPKYDPIIEGKSTYLNIPFFLLRIVLLLAAYCYIAHYFVKNSQQEDHIGGISNYKKNFRLSAIFIVVFMFTYPLFSFDVVMSLEAHWYSTMFGWYNFAGIWVSGLAVMTILFVHLKEKGYLTWFSDHHLHDMGKLVFAFSIFWTYLWFCQFLLIYYANLPEETVYFYKRWAAPYATVFYFIPLLCFVFPLIFLMRRSYKRSAKYLQYVCVIILIGHYLDFYLMIMPGTVHQHPTFGLIEISAIIFFLGLFFYCFFYALSKRSLIAKKHPLLQESINHEI